MEPNKALFSISNLTNAPYRGEIENKEDCNIATMSNDGATLQITK